MSKKPLILRIVGILMLIISVKGTILVFTDTQFDYSGLPTPPVYIMLIVFCLLTLYTLWLSFIKRARY